MNRLLKVNSRWFGMFTAAALLVSGLTAPSALAGPSSPRAAGSAAGPANTWIPASPMNVGRVGATATLLPDGRVLVAGGGTNTAELYNPATRRFTPTAKMPVTVAYATATLLPGGDVLVAGGEHGPNLAQVARAELYDPATGTWTATGSMNTARSGQTATLLPGGDVLVAGGGCNVGHNCDAGSFLNTLASAELYDPATGTWAKTGKMHVGRQFATANLLPGGDVLEAGGFVSCDDDFCSDTTTAELYDPATGVWTKTGSMHDAREQQTGTLLQDGQVLVAGGLTEGGSNGFGHGWASAELYDPATGTWSMTASMSRVHSGATATLLSNGWVLVAGGQTSVAEIYEPQTGTWVLPGAMSTTRTDQTATLLPDGHVLVTGGSARGAAQSTAEVFLAGPGPLVSISPASIAFGGQQVGTTSAARTFTVTNMGSASLVTNGVNVSGQNPGDYRATTSCAKAPVAPGGTCTVSVTFAPAATALRTAVLGLSDNAPRSPQPVTVNGYGGGPSAWVPVGSLPVATELASSVLLPSGEVLIAAGETLPGEPTASAELYNPATRTFTATGSLNTARQSATAVLLQNGEVLIAGGQDANLHELASAELYNPATGTWSNAAPMKAPGGGLTSTLLPNGNVLVTGFFVGVPDNRGELYDPSTNTWTSTGVMPSVQIDARAILLADGQVLLAGGGTKAAELYDPAANTWTATGSMTVAQQGPLATLLPGGDVEVAGGTVPHTATPLSATEMYDPTTGTWTKGYSMPSPRYGGTATLLPDGTVLATGGCDSCDLAEGAGTPGTLLFQQDQFWDVNTNMTQPRVFQTATLLPGGDVLVAGGGTCLDCAGTATAELYTPALLSLSPTSGPAGTQVTVTGNGYYGHEPIRVSLDGVTLLASLKSAADGTFTAKVTIPPVSPGVHSISANGLRSFTVTFAGFTVTS